MEVLRSHFWVEVPVPLLCCLLTWRGTPPLHCHVPTCEHSLQEPKAANVPGAKFSGKKTKAAAKEGPAKRQWDIMVANGVAIDEIPKFR